MTEMVFSMTVPFLALFIDALGIFNKWQLNMLTGIAFATTFLAKAIVSPYWGKLADQYGRKPMCLRASLEMTVTITACGFVPNVAVLIVLRALLGISDAALLPAIQSLMTFYVPKSGFGRIFSYNQSFQALGSVGWPMMGAVVAIMLEYRSVFLATAILEIANVLFLILATKALWHAGPIRQRGPIGGQANIHEINS